MSLSYMLVFCGTKVYRLQVIWIIAFFLLPINNLKILYRVKCNAWLNSLNSYYRRLRIVSLGRQYLFISTYIILKVVSLAIWIILQTKYKIVWLFLYKVIFLQEWIYKWHCITVGNIWELESTLYYGFLLEIRATKIKQKWTKCWFLI